MGAGKGVWSQTWVPFFLLKELGLGVSELVSQPHFHIPWVGTTSTTALQPPCRELMDTKSPQSAVRISASLKRKVSLGRTEVAGEWVGLWPGRAGIARHLQSYLPQPLLPALGGPAIRPFQWVQERCWGGPLSWELTKALGLPSCSGESPPSLFVGGRQMCPHLKQ